MGGWVDGRVGGWMGGQTGGWVDGWVGGRRTNRDGYNIYKPLNSLSYSMGDYLPLPIRRPIDLRTCRPTTIFLNNLNIIMLNHTSFEQNSEILKRCSQ